jgi:hypothetical protein
MQVQLRLPQAPANDLHRFPRAGMPVPTERIAAPAPHVVSLMDALKRSLATEGANAPDQVTAKAKLKKRGAGQRESCCRLRARAPLKLTTAAHDTSKRTPEATLVRAESMVAFQLSGGFIEPLPLPRQRRPALTIRRT